MVSTDSCPSQSAITERSTPWWSNSMAAVWRRTWGVTFLRLREGQCDCANLQCLATNRSTASLLRGPPRMLGKTGSFGCPLISQSQDVTTSAVSRRRGVLRCFLPFPLHLICAPIPKTTSSQRRPISSDTLSPVWIAVKRKVQSRRPIQVFLSGAFVRASISLRVRNSIGRLSKRLLGIARI